MFGIRTFFSADKSKLKQVNLLAICWDPYWLYLIMIKREKWHMVQWIHTVMLHNNLLLYCLYFFNESYDNNYSTTFFNHWIAWHYNWHANFFWSLFLIFCSCLYDPSSVFAPCNTVVPAGPFLTSCRSDVCNSGNATGCTSLEAYATQCSVAGVCIDWRNATNGQCGKICR